MASDPSRPTGPLDLVAFACELAMFALLAMTGHDLAGIVGAVALPAIAIAIWSVWIAPNSGRRLRNPVRLLVQSTLFIGTAIACVTTGAPMTGVIFVVVAIATFGALSRTEP